MTQSVRALYRTAGRGVSRTLRHWSEGFFHVLRESLTNLILFAGLAVIVRGCALISDALAWLVAGAFLFALGLVLTLNEGRGH